MSGWHGHPDTGFVWRMVALAVSLGGTVALVLWWALR